MTVGIDDLTDAERIFDALAKNGTVKMPIQKTFWAVRSECLSINSGFRGWLTASRPPEIEQSSCVACGSL